VAKQPNIILIETDQQRYDTIAALGFSYMDTPNLDRLVREGVAFTNAFVASASCVPTRASLYQGVYAHTSGIYSNSAWHRTWVGNLADVGYYCVNVGKMHTSPPETPAGFHERYVVENKDKQGYYFDRWDMAIRARGHEKPGRRIYRRLPDYRDRLGAFEWSLDDDLHSDFFVGDLATWWIESHPRVEPLFLEIGFPGPHPPYDPIERYTKPYLERDIPVPHPTPEELEGQPAALKGMRDHNVLVDHDSVCWPEEPSQEELRRLRAYYLANVTMIDEKIGQVLQALEDKGYLEDAVVVFTSDHGDCLGDHGESQKWSMYDIVTRVPLIVWAPGRYAGGQTHDALVQQMDIATVLLDLAGAERLDPWEAISLQPMLEGDPDAQGREYVFAEESGDEFRPAADLATMVRSKDWKLVHYVGQSDGELYDLRADPEEIRNLWADPDYADQRQHMLDVLREWLIESNLRTARGPKQRPNPLAGHSQRMVMENAVAGKKAGEK